MEIVILVALIVLNGVFALSEIALVTARRGRMQRLIDDGDRAAIAAAKLGEDPTRFLSTIQIGITSIGILNGIVGEAVLADPLERQFIAAGLEIHVADYLATGLVVVAITYLSIVVGELVPKRIGQADPEKFARMVARPIDLLAHATKPFVWLLTFSTQWLLRMLGVRNEGGHAVTEEEIHAMLAEGTSAGVIDSHEHLMVRNVFRLDDRQITSLMVPRADVVTLKIDQPFEEHLQQIERSDYAHYPVVKSGLDSMIGVVNARRWFSRVLKGDARELASQPLDAALYVPESLTGMELLESFRSSDVHTAFVVDEYGEIQGIITLQDLIEAITGEFKPRDLKSSWAVRREDGSWLLDGHIPIPELKDRLGISKVPEEEHGRYHTLSGMMMLLTGRLPHTGDTTYWAGWKFEIVDMDGNTIDKVIASRGDGPSEASSAELHR
jgi:putative hemolysin